MPVLKNTCRTILVLYSMYKNKYEADMSLYEMSSKTQYLATALEYKEQANVTALEYNTYVLKNAYVWDEHNHIPSDIQETLQLIK